MSRANSIDEYLRGCGQHVKVASIDGVPVPGAELRAKYIPEHPEPAARNHMIADLTAAVAPTKKRQPYQIPGDLLEPAEALEGDDMLRLFEWRDRAVNDCPELSLLYHIPNGGRRDSGEAARLKAEGVAAGVPDLHLPVPRYSAAEPYSKLLYLSFYCEAKRLDGRLTESQRYWFRALRQQGHMVIVGFGWRHIAEQVLSYLRREDLIWTVRSV